MTLVCEGGEIQSSPARSEPAATTTCAARANREAIGEGLRPSVADPGDLVRMLEAMKSRSATRMCCR